MAAFVPPIPILAYELFPLVNPFSPAFSCPRFQFKKSDYPMANEEQD